MPRLPIGVGRQKQRVRFFSAREMRRHALIALDPWYFIANWCSVSTAPPSAQGRAHAIGASLEVLARYFLMVFALAGDSRYEIAAQSRLCKRQTFRRQVSIERRTLARWLNST